MINNMSTHEQYKAIQGMWWYQQAEQSRLRKLHIPKHWLVLVWQKSKKWTECVKCGLIADKDSIKTACGTFPGW